MVFTTKTADLPLALVPVKPRPSPAPSPGHAFRSVPVCHPRLAPTKPLRSSQPLPWLAVMADSTGDGSPLKCQPASRSPAAPEERHDDISAATAAHPRTCPQFNALFLSRAMSARRVDDINPTPALLHAWLFFVHSCRAEPLLSCHRNPGVHRAPPGPLAPRGRCMDACGPGAAPATRRVSRGAFAELKVGSALPGTTESGPLFVTPGSPENAGRGRDGLDREFGSSL